MTFVITKKKQIKIANFNFTRRDLRNTSQADIDFAYIANMNSIEAIYYDEFHYCSFTPSIPHCMPSTDGVSTLEDLLSNPVLRYATWSMATITCLGNGLVLWGRFTHRDESRAVSMVIRNLAVADMMMGFYLSVIGVQDYRFRANYHVSSFAWMASWQCIGAGMLAMISSEVSLLILTFISVERFLLIADPFGGHRRLTTHNVLLFLFSIWLTGTAIAIWPGEVPQSGEDNRHDFIVGLFCFPFEQSYTGATALSTMDRIREHVFRCICGNGFHLAGNIRPPYLWA